MYNIDVVTRFYRVLVTFSITLLFANAQNNGCICEGNETSNQISPATKQTPDETSFNPPVLKLSINDNSNAEVAVKPFETTTVKAEVLNAPANALVLVDLEITGSRTSTLKSGEQNPYTYQTKFPAGTYQISSRAKIQTSPLIILESTPKTITLSATVENPSPENKNDSKPESDLVVSFDTRSDFVHRDKKTEITISLRSVRLSNPVALKLTKVSLQTVSGTTSDITGDFTNDTPGGRSLTVYTGSIKLTEESENNALIVEATVDDKAIKPVKTSFKVLAKEFRSNLVTITNENNAPITSFTLKDGQNILNFSLNDTSVPVQWKFEASQTNMKVENTKVTITSAQNQNIRMIASAFANNDLVARIILIYGEIQYAEFSIDSRFSVMELDGIANEKAKLVPYNFGNTFIIYLYENKPVMDKDEEDRDIISTHIHSIRIASLDCSNGDRKCKFAGKNTTLSWTTSHNATLSTYTSSFFNTMFSLQSDQNFKVGFIGDKVVIYNSSTKQLIGKESTNQLYPLSITKFPFEKLSSLFDIKGKLLSNGAISVIMTDGEGGIHKASIDTASWNKISLDHQFQITDASKLSLESGIRVEIIGNSALLYKLGISTNKILKVLNILNGNLNQLKNIRINSESNIEVYEDLDIAKVGSLKSGDPDLLGISYNGTFTIYRQFNDTDFDKFSYISKVQIGNDSIDKVIKDDTTIYLITTTKIIVIDTSTGSHSIIPDCLNIGQVMFHDAALNQNRWLFVVYSNAKMVGETLTQDGPFRVMRFNPSIPCGN